MKKEFRLSGWIRTVRWRISVEDGFLPETRKTIPGKYWSYHHPYGYCVILIISGRIWLRKSRSINPAAGARCLLISGSLPPAPFSRGSASLITMGDDSTFRECLKETPGTRNPPGYLTSKKRAGIFPCKKW